MNEKTFKGRVVQKHETEENWAKSSFVPKQAEIVVYDIDDNYSYERFKIGDGITNVNDLPFTVLQSDWNENDITSSAYVANRTHYDSREWVKLYDGIYSSMTMYGVTLLLADDIDYDFSNVRKIKVLFNEVEYELESKLATNKTQTNEANQMIIFGNLAIAKACSEAAAEMAGITLTFDQEMVDTGEPFCVVGGSISLKEPVTDMHVAMWVEEGKLLSLDEKYIPSTIQRTTDENLETTSKEVVGAINELNTNKAEKSQLPMLITLNKVSTANIEGGTIWTADKTYEEIMEHINNGGTVSLYDTTVGIVANDLQIVDNIILFTFSAGLNNDKHTPRAMLSNLYMTTTFYLISSDNSINVFDSSYDLLSSEEPILNTDNKTVLGAINELEANKAETSQLPMIITLSENEETTTTSEDDGISAQYVQTTTTYKVDKTFEEIKAHIDNGGAVVLYDTTFMTGFTTSTYVVSDESIRFILSLSVNSNNVQTYGVTIPSLYVNYIRYDIYPTDYVEVVESEFDINESENTKLNTTNKTITGSINEVNSNLYSLAEVVNVKPDWNENDESSHAYIENRPFYTADPVNTEIYNDTYTFSLEESIGLYLALLDTSASELSEGQNIKITFDNTEYNLTIKYLTEINSVYAGNGSILNSAFSLSLEDTNEPFVLLYSGNTIGIYTTTTETEHSIAIAVINESIVKLDDKYIEHPLMIINGDISEASEAITEKDVYTIIPDKTYEEVKNHVDNGGHVVFSLNDDWFELVEHIDTHNARDGITQMFKFSKVSVLDYIPGVWEYIIIMTPDYTRYYINYFSVESECSSLNTTEKTLVGAINELLATITDLQAEVAELKATYVDLTEDDANALVEEVFG